jgi:L-alanine-DL-glutamate epimerase-like enolase superfamily enzyme
VACLRVRLAGLAGLVRDGHIAVLEGPGLGVRLIPEAAEPYLRPEDRDFFS